MDEHWRKVIIKEEETNSMMKNKKDIRLSKVGSVNNKETLRLILDA